ncbi:MAG: hypothetical protein ACREVJ_16290 [Gammaproteobacteria bacterium]
MRSKAESARRAGLNRRDLEALAAADALRGLSGNRHQARWHVLGTETPLPLGETPPLPIIHEIEDQTDLLSGLQTVSRDFC